jgi:hypothetical protein
VNACASAIVSLTHPSVTQHSSAAPLPGCATTARTQYPPCPILSATCRAWRHPQPAHSTGSEGGSRESLAGTTTSLHAAQSGTFPISDAVPVATFRPGWTGASYPCGLASEVVIPPVRSHRQPYAEGCKRSKKEQRRGADAPRRCLCSQGMTRISGRNQPRVSRG